MRVAVWPADEGGCGAYRCIWPARALIDQGADIDLRMPGDGSGIDGLFAEQDGIERLVALQSAPEADVVVIQRPLAAWRADLVPLLQRAGVRVVVEIDDDFGAIHPRNTSWRSTHPRTSPASNREHLARACRAADLVTVTTPALAKRYGAHGRVAVVPNMVPERYLSYEAGLREHLSVGWTGSLTTHPTDLQVTRGAIGRALRDATLNGWPAPVEFRVVGTGIGVQHALGLDQAPASTGWLSLDEYPKAMANIGIGIVPLDDIAFNHGKSCLKALEFAAVGVPVVASPTSDNARLHGLGVGLLAEKPKHWASHLRRLIAEPDLRAELAHAGREAARQLTIEGNTDRWWDAWSSCLTRKAVA